MPLPSKSGKEEHYAFVSRCMSNPTMKKEFPNRDQRLAVCFRQARKKALAETLIKFFKSSSKENK